MPMCKGWPLSGRHTLWSSTAGASGVPVGKGVLLAVKIGEMVGLEVGL